MTFWDSLDSPVIYRYPATNSSFRRGRAPRCGNHNYADKFQCNRCHLAQGEACNEGEPRHVGGKQPLTARNGFCAWQGRLQPGNHGLRWKKTIHMLWSWVIEGLCQWMCILLKGFASKSRLVNCYQSLRQCSLSTTPTFSAIRFGALGQNLFLQPCSLAGPSIIQNPVIPSVKDQMDVTYGNLPSILHQWLIKNP